jgi:hypothetical protein
MPAKTANAKSDRFVRPSARSARPAQTAHKPAIRPATPKGISQVRAGLIWLRDHQFTFSMLERDLGRSGGWCHKVIHDSDRYQVTTLDVAVVRAVVRAAQRLHGREQHRYALMTQIILSAAQTLRLVEQLAEEA